VGIPVCYIEELKIKVAELTSSPLVPQTKHQQRCTGQRIYQYNEDNFSILVLVVDNIFTNYKFTIKQRQVVN